MEDMCVLRDCWCIAFLLWTCKQVADSNSHTDGCSGLLLMLDDDVRTEVRHIEWTIIILLAWSVISRTCKFET